MRSDFSLNNNNAFGREMVCSQKSVRNRNFFENAGHVSFSFCQTGPAETHTKPCKTSPQGTSIKWPAIYWDHAVSWGGGVSAVRNQSEIETSLKMRGMSPFLFVKLVQQRRTQNHAKPAHRVRRSSGQPFTGTTRSAGVGGFGLALAILVGAKKLCCAAFLYISCQLFFTT